MGLPTAPVRTPPNPRLPRHAIHRAADLTTESCANSEILLFKRTDGGSSGAIWKALNNSGLQSTSLCCARKAVDAGHISEAELSQILSVFKGALPADICDPSSLGRVRACTLLPIATAASVCRTHGRSPASLAWLRAFSQVPLGIVC